MYAVVTVSPGSVTARQLNGMEFSPQFIYLCASPSETCHNVSKGPPLPGLQAVQPGILRLVCLALSLKRLFIFQNFQNNNRAEWVNMWNKSKYFRKSSIRIAFLHLIWYFTGSSNETMSDQNQSDCKPNMWFWILLFIFFSGFGSEKVFARFFFMSTHIESPMLTVYADLYRATATGRLAEFISSQ